ncbi:hypothetical protein FA15DRAFT_675277 [Coprinopsis marcescibilis]|uniref:ADF-H domain-containing protein n=1 Tax=Coprinopsis marcescibilis TaxID=230819 RepID=A0A5C3KEK0_COPMA|nr:hypothetical protein FA15DRAFT_675277 [Coprinopsis marcescibilis]
MNGTSREAQITAVYESILREDNNWLLLHYEPEYPDNLTLYAYGQDGLEELKNKIYDLDKVFVAFYREEVDINPGYILINFIPLGITGVKRARALVHSRRIGTVFKIHQTMLTVDNLSQLTTSTIHQALVDPGSFSPPPMGHSFSNPPAFSTGRSKDKRPKPIALDLARRSFSETYAPHVPVPHMIPPVPPVPPKPEKSSGMFGNLLRRVKEIETGPPPPTPPPKDAMSPVRRGYSPPPSRSRTLQNHKLPPVPGDSPSSSLADFAVLTHFDNEADAIVVQPQNSSNVTSPSMFHSLPLQGKWARGPASSDPKERARIRQERQQQRELEDKQALEEEQRRQEDSKRRKREQKRREEEEEKQRRAQLEEDLRRIAEEKERRRRQEQEEDERKTRELEERKRAEREKRLDEHRKLESWRQQQERIKEKEILRAEQMKRQESEDRKRKIKQAEKAIAQSPTESMSTGWATVQFHDSLFWKRLYFKFIDGTIYLYRSPKDMNTPVEVSTLRDRVKALKEWSDGYEELEAIPFSFVIEFKDQQTWSLFADSEDDKFRMLGLLHRASGL